MKPLKNILQHSPMASTLEGHDKMLWLASFKLQTKLGLLKLLFHSKTIIFTFLSHLETTQVIARRRYHRAPWTILSVQWSD